MSCYLIWWILMAVPLAVQHSEGSSDIYPLLMENQADHSIHEHAIDITRGSFPSSSLPQEDRLSTNAHISDLPSPSSSSSSSLSSSSAVSHTRNTATNRRTGNYGRRHQSPLNSGLWISIELVVNLSQIIAAIIVLSLSRNERPKAPLFEWIIGYTAGCFSTLPLLYWRYAHRSSQRNDEDSPHLHLESSQNNQNEQTPYSAVSVLQIPETESQRISSNGQDSRFNAVVDHFKMALDCFFAVWFVVGNVWIFGGHSSAANSPNLYRLCIVFLTFSCIGYAMPFILCATICCCLPCIISILGLREDLTLHRGASPEILSSLPTYTFKSKADSSEANAEGGIFAVGTDKERIISAEDAVCCICLAKYADEDELRELSCGHFFHVACVDKWLKINALCPLCKAEVGAPSPPGA